RREHGARDLGLRSADDRELARRREVKVERAEKVAERGRRLREHPRSETEDADGALLHLVVAVDAREPEEDVREHRVARRRRVVVELLLPADEPLPVGRRVEEAAAFIVAKELDGEQGQAA